MAANRLSGRLDALEQAVDPLSSVPVLVVVNPDETADHARARWEAANGNIREGRTIDLRRLVFVTTGVGRMEGSVCA